MDYEVSTLFKKSRDIDQLSAEYTNACILAAAQFAEVDLDEAKLECVQNNTPALMTASEVLFGLNMLDAWRFVIKGCNGYSYCFALHTELHRIVARLLGALPGRCSMVDQVSERVFTDRIGRVAAEENVERRAVKAFKTVIDLNMFAEYNSVIAFLVLNKILIDDHVGIFCPNAEQIREIRRQLEDCKNTCGKCTLSEDCESMSSECVLFEYISKNCIIRV